jgi:NitT/TauT family transport system substrate-binding protein
MNGTLARLAIVAVLTAVGLTQARAAIAAPSTPAPLISITVGVMNGDSAAEGFYAQDMGFFKAAGFDAKLVQMQNAASMTSAMMSGDLEVGVGSIGVIAMAHEKALPLRFFAPASVFDGTIGTSALMVAKDSTARTGADLNGQTVAVNGLKDLTQFTSAAWIDQNGGDVRTIKFVEMPFSEMAVALQQHRVAAAFITEPFLEAAKPIARILGYTQESIAKKYYVMGWFSTDTWARQHADIARRFRLVMQKTAEWANAHPAESGAILARYSRLSPETVSTMIRSHYDTAPKLDPALMQPVIDTAAKYGTLTKPFPAAEIIAPQ